MLSSMCICTLKGRAWCPSVPHPQASPSLFGLSISLEWIGIYLKTKDMWYEKKKRRQLSDFYISLYTMYKQAKVCDDENIRGHFCFSFFFCCCPWIVLRLISLHKCNMTHMEKKNLYYTTIFIFSHPPSGTAKFWYWCSSVSSNAFSLCHRYMPGSSNFFILYPSKYFFFYFISSYTFTLFPPSCSMCVAL